MLSQRLVELRGLLKRDAMSRVVEPQDGCIGDASRQAVGLTGPYQDVPPRPNQQGGSPDLPQPRFGRMPPHGGELAYDRSKRRRPPETHGHVLTKQIAIDRTQELVWIEQTRQRSNPRPPTAE